MIILLLGLFLSLNVPSVYAAPTQYDIVATYNEKEHRIYGSEKITFQNNGPKPLSELYLFLYPNLYLEKDRELNKNLYEKAYPNTFNPGEMLISSVQDVKGTMLPHFPDIFKKRLLVKIALPAPIPPKGTFQFLVHFVTVIPEKWGVFGYYRNVATLQGGWYPYLPQFVDGNWNFLLSPPKSAFRINLTLDKKLKLIGSAPPQLKGSKEDDQTFLMEAEALPFFSLSIGKKISRKETHVDRVDILYHAFKRDRWYAKQVIKISEEAASFFQEQNTPFQTGETPIKLQLAEAYLYQDLVTTGSKILYLNSRLFKVFPILKRFHEASIAKGIFQLLWREKLPDEEGWVIEGLAHLDAEQFMKHKYGGQSSLENWLKPFAFIPLIDQILYSKDLPLRQIYFKEAVPPILNEDIQFFNHPRPEGTMIFSKLRNLLGSQTLNDTVAAYRRQLQLGGKPSFRQVLFKISRSDLNWFFDQWLTTNPVLDFGIEEIRDTKVEGAYRTTILIKKYGEGIEPLEIKVSEENGSEIPLVWDGRGETHEEVLVTPSRVESVELDPDKNSSDLNRLNNRIPAVWKILLNDYGITYDFQTKVISYKAGLLFQRVYDVRNRYRLDFSHSDRGNAYHVEQTQTLRNNHVVTAGLSYDSPITAESNEPEQPAGYLHLKYSLNYPDIPLFAGAIQKLTQTYPKFSISLAYNQQFTGGAYHNSFLLGLDLRRIFSFSNYHEVGTRFFMGQSMGKLFENSRFFLGGGEGIRGYTPLAFEGENISLASVEYRFPLFHQTDLNFLGLAHTHTWQGALFADTGMVTDSRNIFQFSKYRSDVGTGIRFFVDLLGFYPAIVRLDVALPIASPIKSEQKPHFYVTAGQPF
jgi:hypothetical protein